MSIHSKQNIVGYRRGGNGVLTGAGHCSAGRRRRRCPPGSHSGPWCGCTRTEPRTEYPVVLMFYITASLEPSHWSRSLGYSALIGGDTLLCWLLWHLWPIPKYERIYERPLRQVTLEDILCFSVWLYGWRSRNNWKLTGRWRNPVKHEVNHCLVISTGALLGSDA